MPVPDYQTFMLPVLAYAGKHASEAVAVKELYDAMAAQFSLTDAERNELLPSGSQTTFANRVGWAATYMKKAGLLCSPKRGHIQITDLGKQALVSKPTTINTAFLKNYPSFVAFQGKHKTDAADDNGADSEPVSKRTPHEILESGYQSLRSELATELLQRVKESSPAFFERLVVELLLKMGYGGSRADAGKALGKSGDGGIDGIIKEDRLGLDFIFIQAKCWTDKPVFITTTQFTKEATSYAAGLRNSKIVLIDGEDLADLMIDHGIGVATAATYDVKRLDSDYFIESE
jgi:restriction system protein